jgi:hypothetical protein
MSSSGLRTILDPSYICKAELNASDDRRIVARVVQEYLSRTDKAVVVEFGEDLACIVRCGELGGTTWIAMQHSECDSHRMIEIEVSLYALTPLMREGSTSASKVEPADDVWNHVRIDDRSDRGSVEAAIGCGPVTASTRECSSSDRDLKVAIDDTYKFVIVQCEDRDAKLGIGIQRTQYPMKTAIREVCEIYVPQGVLNYRPDDDA